MNYIKLLCIVFVFFATSYLKLSSQETSSVVFYSAVEIANFNDDHALDTLMIKSVDGKIYLDRIIWGVENEIHPDTTVYHKKSSTKIVAPDWSNLKSFVVFDFINQDTTKDLFIYYQGKKRIDSLTILDSVKAVVIFGQCGLDTNTTFNISEIEGVQYLPFVAKSVFCGSEITYNSGFSKSNQNYNLNRIFFPIIPPPPSLHGNTDRVQTETQASSIKVYPNPVSYNANIEFNLAYPGTYKVKILNSIGDIIDTKDCQINTFGSSIENVDMSKYANGLYTIQVELNNQIITNVKIIIVK